MKTTARILLIVLVSILEVLFFGRPEIKSPTRTTTASV